MERRHKQNTRSIPSLDLTADVRLLTTFAQPIPSILHKIFSTLLSLMTRSEWPRFAISAIIMDHGAGLIELHYNCLRTPRNVAERTK